MSGTSNAQYQSILNDLNRDVARQQPSDVLQFCADWFQDKLRDEVGYIHQQQRHPPIPNGTFLACSVSTQANTEAFIIVAHRGSQLCRQGPWRDLASDRTWPN